MSSTRNFNLLLLVVPVAVFLASAVAAQEADQATAPWDYRDPRFALDLATVEKHHYNMDVQTLTRGQSAFHPAQDLEFMFRFFPNHHRALDTMARLWRSHERQGKRPPGVSPGMTAERYFENAIAFAPDDGIVRMLFGVHLYLSGRSEQAEEHYEAALELSPDSADVHYNAGLYYLSAKNFDAAVSHAQRAYELGFPLPGLKNKLVAAGAWDGAVRVQE